MNVCEAEQRSKLIGTLLRLGLVTREVGSFLGKQKENQRSSKQKNQMKSGVQRMREKLSDSRGEEDVLRRVRDKLRVSLEEVLNNKNQYGRIIKKLKAKVQRIKTTIQLKNRNKVTEYKKEKDKNDISELTILQEEMGEFGKLIIFKGITIQPEARKPPVTSKKSLYLRMSSLSSQRTPSLL